MKHVRELKRLNIEATESEIRNIGGNRYSRSHKIIFLPVIILFAIFCISAAILGQLSECGYINFTVMAVIGVVLVWRWVSVMNTIGRKGREFLEEVKKEQYTILEKR